MIPTLPADLRHGHWPARLPGAGTRQCHRRAHRLQFGLRPADGARPGHVHRRGAVRRKASCGSIPNTAARCASSMPPRSAPPQPRHEWADYPVGVARELVRAGYPIARRQPADSQHRAGGFGPQLVGRPGGFLRAGAAERPRHRSAGPGAALPAGRARVRGHAVRHHGPVHLGLRPRALRRRDRLPQPGPPLCDTARRTSPSWPSTPW